LPTQFVFKITYFVDGRDGFACGARRNSIVLAAAVIEFRRPAIGVAGDPLRGFWGSVIRCESR
jgi:hypothetical protein